MGKSVSGIYIIQNTKTGTVYIGQTHDFKYRWAKHRSDLIHNRHKNIHLQRAWNKYGERAFKFKRLEYCPDEQLDKREQHYLDVYMNKGICYNIALDARHGMLGRKHSEETKQKISAALTNPSEETRRKRSKAVRLISEESRLRMSEPNKGKKVSEETRLKMSAAHKGHKHSDETKQKMSKSRQNISEETREKMREGQRRRRERLEGK